MKTAATVLAQLLLAAALCHSTACSTTKAAARRSASSADEARAAQVRELNALIAQGPLYFDTDTDTLTDGSQVLLQKIALQMHKVPKVRVLVAGNADERGDTAYNLALGERRGYAAKEYLMRMGIPKERIQVVSLGEEQPIASGHSEESWSQNRRDEFTFMFPGEHKSALKIGLDDGAGDLVATTTFAQE